MHEHAIAVLAERDIEDPDWRSSTLTGPSIADADLILTATLDHRRAVVSMNPAAVRRTFTLLEFAKLVTLAREDNPTDGAAGTAAEAVALASAGRAHAQSRQAADLEIADPIGQSVAVVREVAAVIDTAVDAIIGALSPTSST